MKNGNFFPRMPLFRTPPPEASTKKPSPWWLPGHQPQEGFPALPKELERQAAEQARRDALQAEEARKAQAEIKKEPRSDQVLPPGGSNGVSRVPWCLLSPAFGDPKFET